MHDHPRKRGCWGHALQRSARKGRCIGRDVWIRIQPQNQRIPIALRGVPIGFQQIVNVLLRMWSNAVRQEHPQSKLKKQQH